MLMGRIRCQADPHAGGRRLVEEGYDAWEHGLDPVSFPVSLTALGFQCLSIRRRAKGLPRVKRIIGMARVPSQEISVERMAIRRENLGIGIDYRGLSVDDQTVEIKNKGADHEGFAGNHCRMGFAVSAFNSMSAPTETGRLGERCRPESTPVMRQRWRHVLFLHWALHPAEIQQTLPPGLTVDVRDGHAWLGVVPFFMQGVRPNRLPAVPGISDFMELNVRTYVYDAQGRPGVWFYSLDANQWLAVKVARAWFHLPYHHAVMTADWSADHREVDYRSRRRRSSTLTRFVYRMPALSETRPAAPGSLEFFLVERYRLFASDRSSGILLTGRVWHEPYQVGPAEVGVWDPVMAGLAGFDLDGRPPDHICASPGPDVEVHDLGPVEEPVRSAEPANEAMSPGPVPA